MADKTELLLASRRCAECLVTKKRVVNGSRAAELVKQCRRDDVHFQCHRGTIAGINLHCRGVHEIAPGRAFRFAKAFDIPIREIDPETLPKVEDDIAE
jgi:hypothetical protein